MRRTAKTTEYRKELKGRILTTAMSEFRLHGIRAVKMDDIANLLSISKRTLYEIYPNKESLLLEGVKLGQEQAEAEMAAYVGQQPRTTIDIMMKFYQMQMEELSTVPPVFLADIARYPTVIAYLESHHSSRQERTSRFFQQGVDEGYFRSDVDYTLVSRLGEGLMQNALIQRLYEDYELPVIFRNIIFIFLRGFCTQKGLDAIDQRLKE